ncbi:hypothetical protein OsI_16683 [Oryza sativa Indica Group]|uniref:Uncharacterized protein n=1 Tax=Oryza sativa subsp. indica TaxID=39946 RepID=B8AS32_ORYSI|nr:hypothetical protein OsI_16683 [Oryza sativa Indica Group]
MAVVLLLRLVQLPGYLGYLLIRAIRAAVEGAVVAAFAAARDAVAAAADAAAGWRDAASSNSTAAVAFMQAAMGRPEALLAEMLAIFGLVALLSCRPSSQRTRRAKERQEAIDGNGHAKLFITGLSMTITCSSAVVFKGAAMAVVLLLRLVQLPGYLGYLLIRAIRAAVEGAVVAAFAAARDAVAAAADAAAGWRDAASSNSTAAVAFMQAAMGRPEALLAEMLAIFGLVALLSCRPSSQRTRRPTIEDRAACFTQSIGWSFKLAQNKPREK